MAQLGLRLLKIRLVLSEWAAFIAWVTNATSPFCLILSNIVDQMEVVLRVPLHKRSKKFAIKRMKDEKDRVVELFCSVLKVC